MIEVVDDFHLACRQPVHPGDGVDGKALLIEFTAATATTWSAVNGCVQVIALQPWDRQPGKARPGQQLAGAAGGFAERAGATGAADGRSRRRSGSSACSSFK